MAGLDNFKSNISKYVGKVFTESDKTSLLGDVNNLLADGSKKTQGALNSTGNAIDTLNESIKRAATSSASFNANIVDLGGSLLGLLKSIKGLEFSNFIKNFMDITTPFMQLDQALRENVNKQLGITGERAQYLRDEILNASTTLLNYGIEVEDVVSTITVLIGETNRAISIGQKPLEDFMKVSRAAGLTAQDSATFLAKMEGVGRSLLSGQEALTDMQNIATSMGLSSTNLIKTATENLSLINRFGFEDGIRGFSRISAKASLIKFDLKSAAEFADSLFDVDKAIETAAQLNILGGEFGNLSNATDLMFKATNDYAGLTEEIMEAQKQFVTFNEETGEFETDGLGLRRAREFAKVVGKSVDTVIEEAKRASRFDLLSDKLNLFPQLDNEQKELIKNLGSINENGEIEINGKALRELNPEELQKELNTLQQQQIENEKDQLDILREQRNIASVANDYLRMLALQAGTLEFGGNSLYSLMNNDLKEIFNEITDKYSPEQIKKVFGSGTLTLDMITSSIFGEKPITREAIASDLDPDIANKMDSLKKNVEDVIKQMNGGRSMEEKGFTRQTTQTEHNNAMMMQESLSKLGETLNQGIVLNGALEIVVKSPEGMTLTNDQAKFLQQGTNNFRFYKVNNVANKQN